MLDLLAAGHGRQDVLAELPYLTDDDVTACLAYASARLSEPPE